MEKIHSSLYHQSAFGNLNCLSRQHQLFYLLLVIFTLVIFVSPRFIHLDADPTPDYISADIGYHIDEGYKTLAPKNLQVFGKINWHPSDTYPGWLYISPATQWPYYYAFKELGLELKNARLVSTIYFLLFMALTLFFLSRRYGLFLAFITTLFLVSNPALFHFSRSALLETSLILIMYTGIFLTTLYPPDKSIKAILAMTIMMFFAAFAVKLTAVIYCIPAIAACSFLVAFNRVRSRFGKIIIYIIALSMGILSLIILKQAYKLSPRLSIDINHILNFPEVFFHIPMPELSPLALLLAYTCIIHLLLVKPESLYNNIYRLSLVSIIVAVPIIFSLLKYHPPRYFVPIVPACLLLTIEWFHLKPRELRMRDSFSILQKLAITVIIIMYSMLLLRVFDIFILKNMPFIIGEHLEIDNLSFYKILPIFLVGIFVVFYVMRRKAVRILGYTIPLLLIISIVAGVSSQAVALLYASYDSQTIRHALNTIVSDTESIAGDWAPFFTAEAPIRSFYMSKGVNFPDPVHIDTIRPDYFLSSNTPSDNKSQAALESNDQIKLSEPKMIGTYINRDINVYHIRYLNSK